MRRPSFTAALPLCSLLVALSGAASEIPTDAVDNGVTGAKADAALGDDFDWGSVSVDESTGYESEVVGYRLRPTDRTVGFGETIEVDEKRKSLSDVSEVLSQTVGVQVRTMGGLGAYGAASVRGSTPAQVPVFLDGVQLNIGGFSTVNLGDFSLDTLESIEIYRGNAPLRLGTGGIGGALVLRTKQPKTAVSEYAASYGSWNTWRLMTLFGAKIGKTDILLIVSGRHSDGDFRYYNRNGTPNTTDDDRFVNRTNNDCTSESALLKVSRPIGKWKLQLMDDLFFKNQGLAGIDSMVGKSTAELSTLRNTLNLRFERPLGQKTVLDLDLGHLLLHERYEDLTGSIGVGHQDQEYRTDGVSVAAVATTTFTPKHVTTFRVAERYERFDEYRHQLPPDEQLSPSHRARTELGIEHDFAPWTSLHIVPTVRGEIHYSYFGGGGSPSPLDNGKAASKTDFFISPSLGLRFEPIDGLILRANGGRYNRTPELTELFGDRGSVVGNPDLEAETGNNVDAGVSYMTATGGPLRLLRADVVWFGSWVDNLISFEQNSQDTTHPVNVDSAVIQGVELALRLNLFDIAKLSGNYTYFYGVNRSDAKRYDGKKLPGRPAHQVYGRLDLGKTFEKWGFGVWFDADFADTAYVSRYNNDDRYSMHLFLGAGGKIELPKAGFTFTFEAKNITDNLVFKNDEGVWLPMSDYNRYPLPGRTLLGTIHWRRPNP